MEIGWTQGVITVLTLFVFLGICWWAYRPGNKERFEADAMLPFADADDDPARDLDANANVRDGRPR